MKKIILYIIMFLFVAITSVACDTEKSVILFNRDPITKDTIFSETNTNVFKPNSRIYYLVTLPEQLEKKMLLIQVVKVGSGDIERLGYDLVWSKRVKVREEQAHYYTDYIVLSQTGAYAMKVYSRDNPTKILTTANFYVRN